MAVTTNWYNEDQTIILITHESGWTWAEYHASVVELYRLLDSVSHVVDTIIDFRTSATLPSGTPSQLGKINEYMKHPHLGNNVIVGANSLIKVFVNIIASVYPPLKQKIQIASSLSEATDMLLQQRKQGRGNVESTQK